MSVATSDNEQFALLEHMPAATYVYDADGDDFVLRFVNAAARAQNPALVAFVGKPMAGLYRDQPELVLDARRAIAEQQPVVSEVVLRRHDHTEAATSLRLTWVPLSPTRLMIVTQSTARTSDTEAALRESEARYRGLLGSLPDGVILRGADGRVLACNEVAARLCGTDDPTSLVGRVRVLAAGVALRDEAGAPVPEEELPSVQCIRTGKRFGPVIHEVVNRGQSCWVRSVSEPIHASTGAVSASVTLLTDITDRIHAERALRAAVTRLDLALAAGRMGVWEYDVGTNSGWWSENLGQIFGFTGTRPQGMDAFVTMIHPDDRARFAATAAAQVASAGGRSFDVEFRLVGDDKVVRWARIQGRVLADPARVAGAIVDVTEQHRLEDELRRAHRLESIGRLAGGVAHDFNNLLAAMMGALELIEAADPPHLRREVETLHHGVVRARDLTRQLLAFARKQPVEFHEVDLSEMVTTVVERMLRRLVGPSIELVVETPGPVRVRADRGSLEQVLVNLAVNARDAMPSGGRLAVRVIEERPAGEAPPRAVLEVTDSGTGMDEETRRQVFEPFFTTKTRGTGLGLASSYGIVRQHDGDITVESEPGAGTTFRVVLPRIEAAPPPEPRPVPPPAPPAPAPPRKGCVLIVDDEELVLNTAVRVVRSLGYDVLAASSDARALELARTHPGTIDVLLCDIAMPGREGPALARELQALRPGLRTIFVSGYADSTAHLAVERATFLAKPYSRAELLARLEER